MTEFDLVIRDGDVVTSGSMFTADVGIKDGTIVALGKGLGRGKEEISASGQFVMPGGIDPHCHIEEVGQDPIGAARRTSFA